MSTFLVLLALLLIGAVNCAVFLFFSILSVRGDGGPSATETIWLVGFGWIAAFFIVSLVLCVRKSARTAILFSAGALPLGYASWIVYFQVDLQVDRIYRSMTLNSAEFALACAGTGAKFVAKPAAPVRSIAYDWTGDPPKFKHFNIEWNGNISFGGGYGFALLPAQIAFTESRCCRSEGRPGNGISPYIRQPNENNGGYFGVTDLTADVLVMFRASPVGVESQESNLTKVDVTVTDRRDGRMLASLSYAIDERKRRGCGETSERLMDERAFVLRAVGVR